MILWGKQHIHLLLCKTQKIRASGFREVEKLQEYVLM